MTELSRYTQSRIDEVVERTLRISYRTRRRTMFLIPLIGLIVLSFLVYKADQLDDGNLFLCVMLVSLSMICGLVAWTCPGGTR